MNRGGGDLLLEQVLEAVHGLPPLVRAERHGGGGDVGRNIWRLASYRTRTLKKTVFCPGSITPFVPVLEPGFAFRERSLV